jgi:hypothetical protein
MLVVRCHTLLYVHVCVDARRMAPISTRHRSPAARSFPKIDRPYSSHLGFRRTAHAASAPSFKWIGSRSSNALIQENQASIIERPHSSDPAAPLIINHSEAPRPHSRDLARILARLRSSQSMRPHSRLPGLRTTGSALNQSGNQAD